MQVFTRGQGVGCVHHHRHAVGVGDADHVCERYVPYRRVADPVNHRHVVVERCVVFLRRCDVVFADLGEAHSGSLYGDRVAAVNVLLTLRGVGTRETFCNALGLHPSEVRQLLGLDAVGPGEDSGGPYEHRRRASGHDEAVIGVRVACNDPARRLLKFHQVNRVGGRRPHGFERRLGY